MADLELPTSVVLGVFDSFELEPLDAVTVSVVVLGEVLALVSNNAKSSEELAQSIAKPLAEHIRMARYHQTKAQE